MDNRVARRHFLKLLTLGVAGLHVTEIDVDQLLWVPGKKKIFLPPNPMRTGMSYAQIVDIELQRVIPHIRTLFERDDNFYQILSDKRFK